MKLPTMRLIFGTMGLKNYQIALDSLNLNLSLCPMMSIKCGQQYGKKKKKSNLMMMIQRKMMEQTQMMKETWEQQKLKKRKVKERMKLSQLLQVQELNLKVQKLEQLIEIEGYKTMIRHHIASILICTNTCGYTCIHVFATDCSIF